MGCTFGEYGGCRYGTYQFSTGNDTCTVVNTMGKIPLPRLLKAQITSSAPIVDCQKATGQVA